LIGIKLIPYCSITYAWVLTTTMAQKLSITPTNQELHFIPVIIASHTGDNKIFMLESIASSVLQAMTEGFNISRLVSILTNGNVTINENPETGLLAPVMSASFNLTNDSANTHLSLSDMLLPSNDDFVGLESNMATTTSEGAVSSGARVTLEISTTELTATYLTVTTMLVNTNDALSGLTGVDISTLALNQEKSGQLNVYDLGTEQHNEAASTIPSLTNEGIGYDTIRNDIDIVGYHSGVVSQDDGLSSSVLTQVHQFDNPAVKINHYSN
jgi:hypothetical protein